MTRLDLDQGLPGQGLGSHQTDHRHTGPDRVSKAGTFNIHLPQRPGKLILVLVYALFKHVFFLGMPTPSLIPKRKNFDPTQMAIEQGFIFWGAKHQEFMTRFWNMGESGHCNSTAIGLPSRKSNSQPQNGGDGVFIPFQPLIEWCSECVWPLPFGNGKQLWL